MLIASDHDAIGDLAPIGEFGVVVNIQSPREVSTGGHYITPEGATGKGLTTNYSE